LRGMPQTSPCERDLRPRPGRSRTHDQPSDTLGRGHDCTIAEQSDPAQARVSLDEVIAAMWETAVEMNERYKETSLGGLAVKLNVTVGLAEC
ncbi:MAG: hypothetical protein AAGA55_04910, partial [Planctomycetota bacterium]